MPEVRSPTVRRRELGALLRTADRERPHRRAGRRSAAVLYEQAEPHGDRSRRRYSPGHPRPMRPLRRDRRGRTRAHDEARAEGKQQAWWQSYDLGYATYVGLEAEAVAISAFQSSVVHGLLHTADYARAGHEVAMPLLSPDQIELQIEAKLTRQRILTQEPAPFSVVLDEAALHRMIGGRQVMAAQLAKILDMAALPNVVVQVLPFELGAHPAMESNFTILELPNPTPGVVFVEGLIGSTYLERDDDLKRYQEIFSHLQSIALSPQDTAELIAKFIRAYKEALVAALQDL